MRWNSGKNKYFNTLQRNMYLTFNLIYFFSLGHPR